MSTENNQPAIAQSNAFSDCISSEITEQAILSRPVIGSLSLRMASKFNVRGSTSAQKGVVEVFSDNTWKGIANVTANGTFENADLPKHYLTSKDTVLVRVVDGEPSIPVLANNYFVHPRSVWVTPTPTKQADQKAYRWLLQWADYQPTGYKLPANTRASLYLEGDDPNVTLTIGVQGLAQRLDRRLQTPNMREYRLTNGENVLPIDLLGGVVHIRNNGNSGCRVIFGSEFQPIPYYIHGQTPAADFHEMLELSNAQSVVQLVGDRLVISAYADTYKRFAHKDVGEIVHSHEEVLSIQVKACGLDGSSPRHARSDMWIHAVEAASTINPSATTGYIALPHGSNPGNEYMCALLAGEAHKRWVTLHEYGHHFQNNVNSAKGFIEVSVNIYALAVGRKHDNEYKEEFPKRWRALKTWLEKPASEKMFNESPDPQAIFEQLRKQFSATFLPKWDRYIRDNPHVTADLIGFTTSLCIVSKYNLADFFVGWGVIKEGDGTYEAMQALGLPKAPSGMIMIRPYV